MSCNCENTRKEGLISPTESCILCCQKHFSVAIGTYLKTGLEFPNRQVILGELNLAYYHSRLEYSELSDELLELISNISNRSDSDLLDKFNTLSIKLDSEVQDTISNEKYSYLNAKIDFDDSSKSLGYAELSVCTAWRLSEELGYEGINRNLIINELVISQMVASKLNSELSNKIRTLRYSVMKLGKTDRIEYSVWEKLLMEFNSLLIPSDT